MSNAYADNSPVINVDPDGHFAIAVGFGIYISAKFIGTVVVMGIGAGIGYYAAKKKPYYNKKSVSKFANNSGRYAKKKSAKPSAEHTKGKRKSTSDKHTKKRPGGYEKKTRRIRKKDQEDTKKRRQ
ncbi:hypothetical protein [Enterococcus sp. AD013-P3]|uniref:hypothetical protein n=1 Tax=Enterococcus sp. AD013-P3 TaxID=3411036 RepID=UPI003B92ACC6